MKKLNQFKRILFILNLVYMKISDIIIEGIGTHPNSSFLRSSNIHIDKQGFIPVDDCFKTNIPDIYALGDVITSHNMNAQVPLAWGASSCSKYYSRTTLR